MSTLTSRVRNTEYVENVPVNQPRRYNRYDKNNGVGDNKQASYKTIYFCPVCKRAWQKIAGETDYFPKWIIGDRDKVCKKCRANKEKL